MFSSRIEVSLCMYVYLSACEEMFCWEKKSLCIFFSILKGSCPLVKKTPADLVQCMSRGNHLFLLYCFTGIATALYIILGQRQVNESQVDPPCVSSDQERLINSGLRRWIGVQLPRFRVVMEMWQFKSNSCFSWPQKREHFHSPETTLNWNVWICALMCVWLFSLLIRG